MLVGSLLLFHCLLPMGIMSLEVLIRGTASTWEGFQRAALGESVFTALLSGAAWIVIPWDASSEAGTSWERCAACAGRGGRPGSKPRSGHGSALAAVPPLAPCPCDFPAAAWAAFLQGMRQE